MWTGIVVEKSETGREKRALEIRGCNVRPAPKTVCEKQMSAPKNISDLQATGFVQGVDGSFHKPKQRSLAALAPAFTAAAMVKRVPKSLLNKTEARWLAVLEGRGHAVLKQAITLRLDPPFKSYRPDMSYVYCGKLTLVEVKGPHRFREKGIARAALAAKTYPMFRFELADWTAKGWKESVLSA
jgi:hypothetical protein